ncbi:MAG TPA: glycine--tRNA ligase [Dehalococcoidales bacterium]|nr:glycine--tRNA ligase [Dehalococcoidales bacterium]
MADNQPGKVTLDKLVSLCQRRGFIFPSSDIYGGLSGCWDYGPVGVELKRNVKAAWWKSIVTDRDDMVGLDTSILMNSRVWQASGHVANFSDPLVECKECHLRWKADDLKENACPSCGGKLTEERMFNTMFKTFVGPLEEEAATVYLRPETAQGMFVNFPNVISTTRKRLPFGIAQQGKCFRNEITTGNFTFRSREFEIMEFEFFVKPGTDEKWWSYWVDERFNWYIKHGVKKENLDLHAHPKEKLAHYARACSDIIYNFPHGWSELEGIANRTDFDLKQHSAASGKSMEYFDDESKEHFIPYIIEPSAGIDRAILAFLCDAYDEEPDKDEIRVVFHFHPDIAPIKVAVLPLSRKENLAAVAKKEVYDVLRPCFTTQYDDTQSIGRRYRRQDELGTPYCVTVDFESLNDKMATIRERDSMNQIRVPIATLPKVLQAKLKGEVFRVLPEGGVKVEKKG